MSLRMLRTSFVFAVGVAVVACGFDAEPQKNPSLPPSTPMAGSNSAGTTTMPTAGTFGAGGDTGAGGTFGGAGTFGMGGDVGGTAGTPAGGGDAGTAGTATAGAGGTPVVPAVCPMPVNAEAALPLTVSGNFIPSGYFAGPPANTAGILAAACEARPGTHTVGECYKFTFQAAMVEATGAYGGVFWQYGANNWGTAPGMKVAAGATKVNFKAWGAVGGEAVTFSAGGIAGQPCSDGVSLGNGGGTMATLTTTPTAYSVDLMGQTYPNGIIGGFVWSTAVTTTEEMVTFYVDEIQWVQ
jgi:hypothetical protein